MTAEQLQGIAWLIIGVVFGAAIVYSMRRRKIAFPAYRAWLLLLFISMFVVDSLEHRSLGALFVWASSIIGLSLVLDILTFWGKELNEKLAITLMLIVTVVGGISANVYIFSTPSSVAVRIFSLTVFVLVIAPVLFALIAYLKGKKELSKKLINIGFYSAA